MQQFLQQLQQFSTKKKEEEEEEEEEKKKRGARSGRRTSSRRRRRTWRRNDFVTWVPCVSEHDSVERVRTVFPGRRNMRNSS